MWTHSSENGSQNGLLECHLLKKMTISQSKIGQKSKDDHHFGKFLSANAETEICGLKDLKDSERQPIRTYVLMRRLNRHVRKQASQCYLTRREFEVGGAKRLPRGSSVALDNSVVPNVREKNGGINILPSSLDILLLQFKRRHVIGGKMVIPTCSVLLNGIF